MNLTIQADRVTPRFLWGLLAAALVGSASGQVAPLPTPVVQRSAVGERIQDGDALQPRSASGTSSRSTNTSYTLLVNDLIRVEVYNEKDLERVTRVDQDGTISLPLIQTVQVAGKTVAEARALIRGLYEKDYLVSAGVDISVVMSSQTNKVAEAKVKLLKFTVSGEVKKPGIVEIPEGEKVNLVEAILLAGDFTGLANKKSVSIMRVEKGEQKVYKEDVQSMLVDPKSKRFQILPGDVISVKQTIF